MNDKNAPPSLSAAGKREAELRRQRQAEALRQNLLRRKAQARGRTEDGSPPSGADDSPPPAPDPAAKD